MSEERIVPGAEEFAPPRRARKVVWTNVFQALLVAVVVLWMMDVPRQCSDCRFYTEQMLTVCIGLTLALAFMVETDQQAVADPVGRRGRNADPAGLHRLSLACGCGKSAAIRRRASWCCWPGPFLGARARTAHYFDWIGVVASLVICGYIAVRYEPLTYEIAMLPVEGIVGSAILIFLVLDGSRRTSGWGFVAIILAMAVYIFISPHLPGDFATRIRLARAADRLSRPRHQRHHRLDRRASRCWW